MRRLLLGVLAIAAVLAGCGHTGQPAPPHPQPPATLASPPVKITAAATNVTVKTGIETATVSWQAVSTTNLLHWLIEAQQGTGAWQKEPELPASATSDTLKLPSGQWRFRVWAVVKQSATEGSGTVEPAPTPPPEPEPSSMMVAVDTGGWTGQLFTELISGGISYFRVQQGAAASVPAGHIASIIFGTGGTIGSINPASYAAEATSVSGRTHPFTIEVLNEPGGNWYWKDPTNYKAYTALAKATHEALASLGAERPQEICSWDGGQGGSDTFGRGIKAAGALPYCDAVSVHPYGGSSGQHGGALGDRANVERAHAESGLPVDITEVGWTQNQTGDSQASSEAEQAADITSFVSYARHLGYVKLFVYFNAVDYAGASYGIEHANRTHKPAFAALAAAAK